MKPKLKPLPQAIREFISEMDFPPAPARGPSSNTVYSAVIQALMGHARHLRPEDTTVTVTPSSKQLADVLHCATRTVRSHIEALEKHGIVVRQIRNGDLSNVYTIFKHSPKLKRVEQDVHPTGGGREEQDVHPPAQEKETQGGKLDGLGWKTTPSREEQELLLRSKPFRNNASGEASDSFLDTNSQTPGPQHVDGENGSPTSSSYAPGEVPALPIEELVGTDTVFFCPRCGGENQSISHQHECRNCLNTIKSGLQRPFTAIEGRNHMVAQLEKLLGDDEARRAFYRDLTPAERQWVKDCEMFYAEEMAECDEADKRQELLDRCGVPEDGAL